MHSTVVKDASVRIIRSKIKKRFSNFNITALEMLQSVEEEEKNDEVYTGYVKMWYM